MKGLFAVAGLAVFLVACSDTTIPDSLRQPHVAAKDGIPPPPPLSGSGDGFLELGSDLVAQASVSNGSLPLCNGPNFVLSYDFNYLQPDPNNQQVVHLKLDGTLSGEIVLHQNQNGKSNAQGNISDGNFSFNLQSGDVIFLSSSSFDFNVTGILTNLATGFKCQASGDLSGSLQGEID